MSRRQHICDVPGCTHTRQRWQRLCLVCYGELPREVRNNLIRAHAEKRMADWRSWKRKAARSSPPAAPRAHPQPDGPPKTPSTCTRACSVKGPIDANRLIERCV